MSYLQATFRGHHPTLAAFWATLALVSVSLWSIAEVLMGFGLVRTLPVGGIPGPSLSIWFGIALLGLVPPLAMALTPYAILHTIAKTLLSTFACGILLGCIIS